MLHQYLITDVDQEKEEEFNYKESIVLQKNWMELIKPSKMDVNVHDNDGKKGVLIAEPLERGFGLTLGNAIRRILLSSLQILAFLVLLLRLRNYQHLAGLDSLMKLFHLVYQLYLAELHSFLSLY